MNCKAVVDRLTLLAGEELPAEEMLAVRAHLAECEACGATYRDVTGLVAELRNLPPPQTPLDLRGRIAMALDAVDRAEAADQTQRRSPWEVVGPYLAAAAVIAIAFTLTTFLTRPHSGGRVARAPSQAGAPAETVSTIEAPSGEDAADETHSGSSADEEKEAVEKARRAIRKYQEEAEMADRDEELLWPEELEPGRATGETPATGPGPAEPPGTRPRTFSAPTARSSNRTVPEPGKPTQIELRFTPPTDPAVGTTAHGTVELLAREDIPQVSVSATGDDGLKIDKPGGTLYAGPLRAGEAVRVPLPMVASKPGLHEIEVKVRSDTPGANTELTAFVPNFRSAAAPRAKPSPGDKPVNLVVKNTPVRQALLDIARQSGARIEIAEGLGTERVSRDVRGVPARAAIRAVAEAGGYRVEETGGVFKITRAPKPDTD